MAERRCLLCGCLRNIHGHGLCRPCYDKHPEPEFFLPLRVPGRWVRDALCTQSDPDLWFPEKGFKATVARKICLRCPVRAKCLDYAASVEQHLPISLWNGIYGGLSVSERRQLYAERAA